MTIFSTRALRRQIVPVLGLAFALPVMAGVPEDAGAPGAAAQAWEAAVERLGATGAEAHDRAALLARVQAQGSLAVIVRLRESDTDGSGPPAEVKARRDAKRAELMARLGLPPGRDRTGQPVKTFERLGGFALRADAVDVLTLADDPAVESVSEDVAYPPALLESVPLLGGVGGAFAGYTGAGQVVAVLDTGVEMTHPMLTGKVVSEACYSTTSLTAGATSLCPGGAGSSTAAGSAAPCSKLAWGAGCDHGTHVAGIAAGNDGTYTGVAKDARVIAIQIYSGFSASACGTTTPCVMAYTSDIIRGLERVYALRTSYAIAAANLSLGGGSNTTNCDGDAAKPAIDTLRAAGIATLVASGNSGYTNGLSSPACISSAVSVGATCDAAGSYCTAVDTVASYSNSAAFLSLLAPGSVITSSVPGGTRAAWHGTSMAAPHLAGAWAVLKQARPGAPVADLLELLKSSGKPVTDARNGVVTPRVELAAAADLLARGWMPALPAAPVLSAASNLTKTGFRVTWTAVSGATGYRLDLSTNSTFTALVSGYADRIVTGGTSLSATGLKGNTTYYVRVRAYNASGVSANSATLSVKTPSK